MGIEIPYIQGYDEILYAWYGPAKIRADRNTKEAPFPDTPSITEITEIPSTQTKTDSDSEEKDEDETDEMNIDYAVDKDEKEFLDGFATPTNSIETNPITFEVSEEAGMDVMDAMEVDVEDLEDVDVDEVDFSLSF